MPNAPGARTSTTAPGTLDGALAAVLFNACPDGVVVADPAGGIVAANAAACAMFDYEDDELIGQPIEVLLPLRYRDLHGSYREAYLAAPRNRAMGEDLDLWGRRRDGSEFAVEVSLNLCTPDDAPVVLAVVRDATAKRATEQRLRDLGHIVDGLAEAVFFADADSYGILYANRVAVTLTGYTAAELQGMTPLELCPDLDGPTLAEQLAPLHGRAATSMVTITTMLRRKDGQEVMTEAEITQPPARPGIKPPFVVLVRDIGERIERLERYRRLAELEATLDDRERIGRDLHDTVIQELFAAGLSLNGLAARADAKVREQLLETVDHLDDIIRQIRTTIFTIGSRSEADDLIDEIERLLDESARLLGWRPQFSSNVATLWVDPRLAEHVIAVLREALSNVVRHAGASQVVVALDRLDDVIMLRVADDGVGLPADVDRAGNGLRNLARRADEVGGTFSIEPNQPTGTVVTFRARATERPSRS